jgi:hypothetical protein
MCIRTNPKIFMHILYKNKNFIFIILWKNTKNQLMSITTSLRLSIRIW